MSRDWFYLTWREKTWSERWQTIIAFSLACTMGLGMLIGGLLYVGQMLDGVTRYKSEHDRCLKNATNGYEIRQCR